MKTNLFFGLALLSMAPKAVRIPFFDESGEPIEAEDWAKGVRKAFKAETGFKVSKGQGNTLGRVNFLVE